MEDCSPRNRTTIQYASGRAISETPVVRFGCWSRLWTRGRAGICPWTLHSPQRLLSCALQRFMMRTRQYGFGMLIYTAHEHVSMTATDAFARARMVLL